MVARPTLEEPEVHFYFNHLHRHWFYPEHTADRAQWTPNSSGRAFSLLKFALNPKEEEEVNNVTVHVQQYQTKLHARQNFCYLLTSHLSICICINTLED